MLSPGSTHTDSTFYLAQLSHQLLLIRKLGGSSSSQDGIW